MKIILKYAGKDATEAFEPIHPPDTLDKYLDKQHHLGEVDMKTVSHKEEEESPEEKERQERIKAMPILEQCYNLMDFESVARRVMKKSAWAYYSSGADDEIVSSLGKHPSDALQLTTSRPCAKTTQPSTRSGSVPAFYTTSKTSTSPPPCSAPKSPSPST